MSTPVTAPPAARPLIVRIRNFIGDVVLLIPALERLAAAGYDLHLAGKPWARSLFEGYGWPVTVYPKKFGQRVAVLKTLAAQLRQQDPGFDRRINAITFATSFSSAFDMRWAGLRPFGYAVEGRRLLLSGHAPIIYGNHALTSYWELIDHFLQAPQKPPPYVTLRLSDAARAEAQAALQAAGVNKPYIVLVPFAGGTFEKLDKKWPHFPALYQSLQAEGYELVLAPCPDEMSTAQSQFPHAKLLPKLALGPYCAVLQQAALTIANDTGPGHMAASVNGKLLSVIGPTKLEQWGALGPQVHVIQSYPEWPSAEAVLAKSKELLAT